MVSLLMRQIPSENIMELEEKYNVLQQSATVLQLEKNEYINELHKLRTTNAELTQKNLFLETTTTDTQRHARYLTRELTENVHELEDESVKNQSLHDTISKQQQLITTLTQENKVLQQSNLHYKAQMEALSNRCRRLEEQSTACREQYEMQLQELAAEIQFLSADKSSRAVSVDDEKSTMQHQRWKAETPTALIPSDGTFDLRTTRVMSTDSYMDTESVTSSVRSPVDYSEYGQHRRRSTIVSLTNNLASIIGRKQSHPATPMSASSFVLGSHVGSSYFARMYQRKTSLETQSQQGDAKTNDDDFSEVSYSDEIEEDGDCDSSPRKAPGFDFLSLQNTMKQQRMQGLQDKLFQQENDMIEVRDAFARQQKESEAQLASANNLNEALKEQNEGLKTENTSLKQQMSEKDAIIEKCTKQTTEMSERFKMQAMRMRENWEQEKQQMYEQFDGEKSEMMGYYNDRMQDMDLRYNTLEHQYIDIEQEIDAKNHTIKELELRNKELEVMTEAPQQSSCYSITEWFKF